MPAPFINSPSDLQQANHTPQCVFDELDAIGVPAPAVSPVVSPEDLEVLAKLDELAEEPEQSVVAEYVAPVSPAAKLKALLLIGDQSTTVSPTGRPNNASVVPGQSDHDMEEFRVALKKTSVLHLT